MEIVQLPHLLQHPLRIMLFQDVKNAPFLRQQLLDGNTDFEYAFLDAGLLISRKHVLAACFRAINDMLEGQLKSRNVHSEIVFSLSPNNNVGRAIDSSRLPHRACFKFDREHLADIPDLTSDRRIFPTLRHLRPKHECTRHQSGRRCCSDRDSPKTACRWKHCVLLGRGTR